MAGRQMKLDRTVDRGIAFLVDEAWLRNLSKWFEGFAKSHEFNVHFAGDRKSGDIDLDQLLALPNTPSSAIEYISAWARTENVSMYVALRGWPYTTPVAYHVSGDEKEAFYYLQELDKRVQDLRQWYTPLARMVDAFGLMGYFLLPLPLWWLLLRLIGFGWNEPVPWLSALATAGGAILCAYSIMRLLAPVLRWFFPVAVFAIGHGAKQQENRVAVRRIIGASLLLAIVAKIISDIVSKRFIA